LQLTPEAELAIRFAKEQRKVLIEHCPFLTIPVHEWNEENLKDKKLEVSYETFLMICISIVVLTDISIAQPKVIKWNGRKVALAISKIPFQLLNIVPRPKGKL
jgi:hypothetical protein